MRKEAVYLLQRDNFIMTLQIPVQCSRYTVSLRSGPYVDQISVESKLSELLQTVHWGPTSLQYSGYQAISGVKRPGRSANHPLTSSAEVKEIVELYL